jgi:hypothetical protein
MRVNSYFARNFRTLIKAGHGPSYGQRGYDPVYQRSNAVLAGKAARERHDDGAPYCAANYRAFGMSYWQASQPVQQAEECTREVKAPLSRQGEPL